MHKKITVYCLVFVLLLLTAFSVSAKTPDSYTRVDSADGSRELRLSRETYIANRKIFADSLGVDVPFEGITDIFSCDDGSILLLCGNESRLYRIDKDLMTASEVMITKNSEETIDYKDAEGVYSKDGKIYIADTSHARILICDLNGNCEEILTVPESSLIPDDFLYQPSKISIDSQGYMYVLSKGCFYGALFFSPEKEFLGFYGSNTIKASALDTLSYLWDKITSNEAKKAASVKTLPYSFVDFSFDNDGYMLTCTGTTDAASNGTGQIKKISPNGSDILYKKNTRGGYSLSSVVNFLEDEMVIRKDRTGQYVPQNIVSIDVDEYDNIYALDMTNGTVYVYDSECNLLSAFAGGLGIGEQLGVFKTPNSLTVSGNNLFITDSANGSITVFTRTEYGETLFNAQSLYLKGNYEEAKPLWEKVLSNDRNSKLAYKGLAISYYNEGNYKAAMNAAKIALDYSVYDLAWKAVIADYVSNNFYIFILVLILLVALVVYLALMFKKKNICDKFSIKTKLFFQSSIHPFKSFEEIKYKKLGSVKIAVIMTVLFFIVSSLRATMSGFLFTYTDLKNYNVIYTLGSTAGLILLWSLCNWLVCSMFSGKGTFKEVYVATTYSLLPFTLFSLVVTLATNFLPLSTTGLVNGIEIAILLYTLFILSVSIMQMHEYDFFKFILTGIVTIFFMILVVFLIFMCAILLMQCVTFIGSLYDEMAYR